MLFQPFYLACLSHGSYLLGSEGEAVVIDPQRDVEQYLKQAESAGLRIRAIIETHLHADFVSGHVELAERTGATVYFGRRAELAFPASKVGDGDELTIGSLTLRFLETPGHTPESISILVSDRQHPEAPAKLFTGDTLFIGDVGRPDLVAAKGLTPEAMAAMMYDSLHTKILALPDDVEVFPAHGAGSSCGRAISDERSSTIGQQRRTNYALQPMSRDEFVAMMTQNLSQPPAYFAFNARMNMQGAATLADLPEVAALAPSDLKVRVAAGDIVLDVRDSAAYTGAHLAGSLNIGIDGRFAHWVGSLIPFGSAIVLIVANDTQLAEARQRLARVGFDQVTGYMVADPASWRASGLDVRQAENVSPVEVAHHLADGWQLLDVRQQSEYEQGHARDAYHHPVDRLGSGVKHLDHRTATLVVCGSGYRSSAAIGMLEAQGFTRLANVVGGMAAWQEAGLPVEVPAKS
jgi:glyoxylase-like metal-dependent hydrolase (beta-lactamase superfamily II)/rhodanese-related sulfurtransferase